MNLKEKNILFLILLSILIQCNCMFIKLFLKSIRFYENKFCVNSTYGSNFAVIVHGWRESCLDSWPRALTQKLETHRGGCIICMDYSKLARWRHYFLLARQTDNIASVLTLKLKKLEQLGFNPANGFIFGFSLGGRVALAAGRLFGYRKIGEIDTCDMAGPGFDFSIDQHDPKKSAINVQCIHTSGDKGTNHRKCHQNWNMGVCGLKQHAAGPPPWGSHGLCPIFYIAAFDYDFLAEYIPMQCGIRTNLSSVWPDKFRMGYMEKRKHGIEGEFYASTTNAFPYTPHIYPYQYASTPPRDIVKLDHVILLMQGLRTKLVINPLQ